MCVYIYVYGSPYTYMPICICVAYTLDIWFVRSLKSNARSVWVKVKYRRPFSGNSIGNHAQLSPTPISDHV